MCESSSGSTGWFGVSTFIGHFKAHIYKVFIHRSCNGQKIHRHLLFFSLPTFDINFSSGFIVRISYTQFTIAPNCVCLCLFPFKQE